MSIRILKSYVKRNGKAKAAVALDLKDTGAINNMIARNVIPERHKERVKSITGIIVSKYRLDGKKEV